jgi:hypothetical protein
MGMSRRAPSSGPARLSVLRGVLLCARGRPEGIAQFGDTSQAFVSSLIPLIVFPLLRAVLIPSGDGLPRGTILLATVTAVLATAVLSHLMAQVFRQEPRWKRYATAVNWNTWILQFGVIIALVAATGLAAAGMNPKMALIGSFVALAVYALWLQFFLARHGLSLSRVRAVLLILAVNAGTAALVMVPELAWQVIDRVGATPSTGGVQA